MKVKQLMLVVVAALGLFSSGVFGWIPNPMDELCRKWALEDGRFIKAQLEQLDMFSLIKMEHWADKSDTCMDICVSVYSPYMVEHEGNCCCASSSPTHEVKRERSSLLSKLKVAAA